MPNSRRNKFESIEREIHALSQADDVLAEIYGDYKKLLKLAQTAANEDVDLERSIEGLEAELNAHLALRNFQFSQGTISPNWEKNQK